MYKLRDWVDETKLMNTLSCNERAVEYLENHTYLIDDIYICNNENAIHIIEKRVSNNICYVLNRNKNAVNFLRNNRHYILYSKLCYNENAIELIDELIKKNELDKIDWYGLSGNPAAIHILNDPNYYKYIKWNDIIYNRNAVELVKNNLHMLDQYWDIICRQPHLIEIIEQNIDKIHWFGLSKNYKAIHILEENIDKIYQFGHALYKNKYGFELLLKIGYIFRDNVLYDKHIIYQYFDYCEQNNIPFNLIINLSDYGYTVKHMEFLKHNNDYRFLSQNPNIFEYDYKRMRETRQSMLWYNDIKK